MFLKISLNLDIQTQYVDILRDYQEAQFKALQYGEFRDVFDLEVAVQKLLFTIKGKREELRNELMGETVKEFAAKYPKYIGDMLRDKLDSLTNKENDALDKAARNANLAMALAGMKPAVPEDWNFFPADANAANGASLENTGRIAGEMVQ